ncbi:MAG TPA: epoxide hydrolase [Thermoanaerobaculia bacterium]|nr:epoxide hydrolase [Thermoanaerobaculia bacterium]
MPSPPASLRVEPFTIAVEDAVLADLQARIRGTRWPEPAPGPAWSQGTDRDYLQRLLAYWADGFDWRAQERALNAYPQFQAELDDVRIHFVHQRAVHGQGIPLIFTHGWPSCFVELLPLVPLLTDPASHGIDGPAFDLVIPSLPGYGFSQRPPRTGVNYRYVAGLWHRLMRGLGYERYGTGGGDFGAGVATYMALDDPQAILGVHLSTPEIAPYTGPGSRPLSPAERVYAEQTAAWDAVERGYSAIQSTKPQTLGYGLNDSPAGLAAWILEKWRSWTDSGGDLDGRLSRDFLLTLLTVYWVSESITTTLRDYFDNRWFPAGLGPDDFVHAPTGIAVFAHHHVSEGEPPREWAERLYNVRRWTRMPRGGHFAGAEESERLARDIAALFAEP